MSKEQKQRLEAELATALAGAEAKSLPGMQAILSDYAELAALEADEETAIATRRAKLTRAHKAMGVPVSAPRRRRA